MSKEKDNCENKAYKEKEKRRPTDLSSSYHEDKLEDDAERSKKDAELAEDKFSSTLYSQISREAKLAENFVQYAENLKECLSNMNAKLDEILLRMNEIIKNTTKKPDFGEPLEAHLKTKKARIAKPLHFAVKALEDSLDEEGLFRISPGLLQLKKAKSMLDAGLPFSKVSGILEDPHVAAGVIKCYLRELPDPLFMSEFLSEWVSIEQLEDDNHRLREIKSIIRNMPDENQENIAFLFQYLQKLTLNCDANKMTQDNVNIVFTPNLLWSREDDRVRGLTRTVKTMLTHVQEIFPEEITCDEEVCSIDSKMGESIIVTRLETFLEREEDICRIVEPTDVDSEKYHSAIQFRNKHKRNQSGSGILGLMTNMNLRKSSSMGHFDNRASRPEKWRTQHQDTL